MKITKISILLVVFCIVKSFAQIPDDTNGRLYRLCKTWGYFKYLHQNRCSLQWDTLLNATINDVLQANTNADFNNALITMFNKVGNNPFVANTGMVPDTNFNYSKSWIQDPNFSQSVRDFLDTFSLYINPDTQLCFIQYNDYSTSYNGYINFNDDSLAMPLNYSDEANRLTIMFYYWNVINYFFPYRNLMDQSWDSTLYEFIPLIRQCNDEASFQVAFLKLATKINDSHGSTSGFYLSNGFWGGVFLPELSFIRVDTHCVVSKFNNISGISVGDILTSIDGISIKDLEDSLIKYIPASTPAAFYRDLYYFMLRGQYGSVMNLTFLDSNNIPYNKLVTRNISVSAWVSWRTDKGPTLPFYKTDCGLGYVDMGKLQVADVPAMYDSLKNTPAIIFDVRSYANGTWLEIAKRILAAPIQSAIIYEPALTWIWSLPKYNYFPGWYYVVLDSGDYYGTWSNPNPYNGKVYLLVNEEAQSHSEFTVQHLCRHPNAKVLGRQSAGADGNISYLKLGGITSYFTSLGWYYYDGYQQQRNGVKIDKVIQPTVWGVRHGKDEILEAAFDDFFSSVQTTTVCGAYISPSGKYTWTISGTYSDTLISSKGCDSILTINLISLSALDTSITQFGDSLVAAPGLSYQWLDCGNSNLPIVNATNQSYVAGTNGVYSVVISKNSCVDTSYCYLVNGVGTGDMIENLEFKMYPNPFNKQLNIGFGEKINSATITIMDYTGRSVITVNGSKTNAINIDTSHLSNGIYFLRIITDKEKTINYKLIRN